jgi:hypothetical protein
MMRLVNAVKDTKNRGPALDLRLALFSFEGEVI